MKKTLYILIVVIALLAGYFIGLHNTNNNTTDNNDSKANIISEVLPKNKLYITADFYETEELTYNSSFNTLNTKINLNTNGKLYAATELFEEEYNVIIELIENNTDTVYYTSPNYIWNISEQLIIEEVINLDNITHKDINYNLKHELKNIDDGNLKYKIIITPSSNNYNVLQTIGILTKQQ